MNLTDCRKYYLDVLRVVSCLAVIMFHISGLWYDTATIGTFNHTFSGIIIYLTSFMVPVFVMISGSLFLDPERDISIGMIFGKYIPKLFVCYLAWSVFYQTIDTHFWSEVNITVSEVITRVLITSYYHLWYLPMAIGLYMITPVLRTVVGKRDTMNYVLVCTISINILSEILEIDGAFSYLTKFIGKLHLGLFTGWIMYYFIGYALSVCTISKRIKKIFFICTLIGFFVCIVTIIQSEQNMVEYLFADYSINKIFYVCSIFIFFKDVCNDDGGNHSRLNRIVTRMSGLTLGVYVVHALFIGARKVFFYGFDSSMSPVLGIPLMWIIVTMLSFLSSYVLKRIPIVKKWLC